LTIKALLYEEFFIIKGAGRQLILRKAAHSTYPSIDETSIKKETGSGKRRFIADP